MSITALTTTFTPAPSCLDGFWTSTWQFFGVPEPKYFSDCFPESYSPHSISYYSPGVCPSGYTAANTEVEFGETTQTCCPTAFDFTTQSVSAQIPAMCVTRYDSSGTIRITSLESGTEVLRVASFVEGDFLNALGVIIRYYSTDFASSTSSSTSTSSETSESSTTSDSTTEASSTTGPESTSALPLPPLPPSSGGMSQGAKIGVGVGVGAAGLLATSALAFWLLRRKKSNKDAQMEQSSSQHDSVLQTPDMRHGQPWNNSVGNFGSNNNTQQDLDEWVPASRTRWQ